MSEPLTGRALAEAALRIMGVGDEHGVHDGAGGFNPGENAAADYVCLEWARGHLNHDEYAYHLAAELKIRITDFSTMGTLAIFTREYRPGAFARALVAASKEGE